MPPKTREMIRARMGMQMIRRAVETERERTRSWPAALLALARSLRPRYWLATTAPPVAKAAKRVTMRTVMASTRLMALTAASPTRATMTVSAMPMETANSCSMTNGMISVTRKRRSNIWDDRSGVCWLTIWTSA